MILPVGRRSRLCSPALCRRLSRGSPDVHELLTRHESTPFRPINLAQLLSCGRPVTARSVLSSGAYTLSEIPRRLAARVRSLEALPFIVGTNPYVAQSLNAFRESFLWFAAYPPVTSLEENALFADKLADLVDKHANDIPTMAKGFQECARHMTPAQVSTFLDGAIRSRISVRLIAEQHIAISQALCDPSANPAHVGVVDMNCSPKKMIDVCASFVSELCDATLGASPNIEIDGDKDATFAYVPVHFEYILTEILKNSFRATVEHRNKLGRVAQSLPPVLITLSPPLSESHARGEAYFSIRIRDEGGGVSHADMNRIFSYAFTTAGRRAEEFGDGRNAESGPYLAQYMGGAASLGTGDINMFGELARKGLQTGLGTIAGLGYGLPMSKLYATYFGGSLDFMSLEGWGSDVFLKLRCLDEAGDSKI